MNHNAISIRPFIGATNFEISRRFYRDWGFKETELFPNMSLFTTDGQSFYLQDAYVADWIDNTMLFLQVADVHRYWEALVQLNLPDAYPGVKLLPIKSYEWGSECFLNDPSGVLWHIGQFNHD